MHGLYDNDMCWLFDVCVYKVPIKTPASEWKFDTAGMYRASNIC